MKVFITGGTGNIGQYVSLAAAEKGHDVVVLSRTPEKYPGLSRLAAEKYSGNISIVRGELTEYELINEYIQDCDAVIHIALGWGNEPFSMSMEDTVPTINLLEMSEKAGVEKFIYTSSTAAMGHSRHNMDESLILQPINLYGATKAASEAYVLAFKEYCAENPTDDNRVTMKRNVIRPGYTFSNPPYANGPSQPDKRFRSITDAVVKNQPIQLIKHDGTQFLSSGQIAELYIALLESELNEEVFLALSSEFTSWQRIAEIALEEYPESKSTIELLDKNYGPEPMLYNVGKMKTTFGLEFKGEEEIRAHVKWNLEESLR
ncbi:MAG: NAD(P)-dependent oxidoreductase [Oscillospiraceae bacterium]|nr:NAD(P)-dependent oxidoreductase [Oscillospiraceae bacterium]